MSNGATRSCSLSGELDYAGGPSLELDDPDNRRRTVQARVSRLKLDDLLMQFDYPDANVHAEKRSVSTTATQKLFMLNSPFMLARAKALACQIADTSASSAEEAIQRAYHLIFGREATEARRQLALNFLDKPQPSQQSRVGTIRAAAAHLQRNALCGLISFPRVRPFSRAAV